MSFILKCSVCGNEFEDSNAPVLEDGRIYLDSQGMSLCFGCIELFNINIEQLEED
jgi:hypothetical protein